MIQKLDGYHNTNPELMESGVIITDGGRHFNINDFDPSIFTIDDYARKLSRLNRYIGDTFHPYNVAQHTVIGAQTFLLMGLVSEAEEFMWHDCSEGVTNDLSPILKKMVGPRFKEIENEISRRICEHNNIPFPHTPMIKEMDNNLASFEISILIHAGKAELYECWDHEKSYNKFMEMYQIIQQMKSYKPKPPGPVDDLPF